jgi:hypothetical protein
MNHETGNSTQAYELEGLYANYFKVGHNPYEFLLDFGQFYRESQEERFHTRIVTSPVYAKAFLMILQDSIMKYEQAYGLIPEEES